MSCGAAGLCGAALVLISTTDPRAARAGEAARDCDDLYFGFGGPVDHAAAYACFDRGRHGEDPDPGSRDVFGRYAPMVLMRLNGDGVPRDLAEAAALLSEWRAAEGEPSEQRLYLERVVLERRSGLDSEPNRRLELCSLPADDRLHARCREIARRRDEGAGQRHVHSALPRIPAAARAHLPGLVAAFGDYADEESARVERIGELEGRRSIASESHRVDLRAAFDSMVQQVLVDRHLPAVAMAQAGRAERRMERVFRDERRDRVAELEVYARALPDRSSWYDRRRRDYEAAADRSQAAWERYRDAWIAVVRAAASTPRAADDAESSLRRRLARERTSTLREGGRQPSERVGEP